MAEVLITHPVDVEAVDARPPDVQQSRVGQHGAALDGPDGHPPHVLRVHVQVVVVKLAGVGVRQSTLAVVESVQAGVEVTTRVWKEGNLVYTYKC